MFHLRDGTRDTPARQQYVFSFSFLDPPGDPGKKSLKLHTLSFV